MVGNKIESSLDIEYTPKREEREYTVKSNSYYTQTKQYDKEGNLEKEIWEREDDLGNIIILDDAVYISKKKFEQIKTQKLKPLELIKFAKREDYIGKNGLIIFLYKGKVYCSSEITNIEPPFGEEYKESVDA